MVGALFFNAATTTNDTSVATFRWAMGATDLTSSIGVASGEQDANASAGFRSLLSTSKCIFTTNGQTGNQTDPVGAYGSTLTNGVRMALSSDGTANRKVTALLISGTDIAMKVGTQAIASGTTSATITHGLGGTPDWIMLWGVFGTSTSEADATGMSVGFWDRTTTNQTCIALRATTGASPTDQAAIVRDNAAGSVLAAAAETCSVTLTSIGSTQFTITLSASAATNTLWGWTALRGASVQMFTKNLLMQNPTSTGTAALVSGMSGKPQAYISLPSRLTTKNAIQTDDSTGSLGFCTAATNDYSTTTYAAAVNTIKDNVATSVAKTRISASNAVLTLDNTGAVDIQATVSSWDSAGVTLNYTNAGASLFYMPVLAFGMTTPTATYIPRRQKRINFPIYYPR